jgi:hypothetical protein
MRVIPTGILKERTRDVYKFKQLLGFLAQSHYVERMRYHVFGAYIGWRGEMVRQDDRNFLTKPLWVLHNLSFYPEKHIGTDVGTMPMVTEGIFWLVHEARHASPRDAHDSDRALVWCDGA